MRSVSGGATTSFRHAHKSYGEGLEEDFRIDVATALAEFRAGSATSLTFPPTLNAFERRYVHFQAGQMGLVSKSHGKGETRALTLSRKRGAPDATRRAPLLALAPAIEDELAAYMGVAPLQLADWRVHDAVAALAAAGGEGRGGGRGRIAPPAPVPAPTHAARAAWQARQDARAAAPAWASLLPARQRLPAWGVRDALAGALRRSQVTIVSGDTGCGKSTQVPQFILDDADLGATANIIVTQPRRISAISLVRAPTRRRDGA